MQLPWAEVVGALRFGQVFQSIAQHDARHAGGVPVEEGQEAGLVDVSGGAQHPANGLVDQVLVVFH
jgi:hypothetical protein